MSVLLHRNSDFTGPGFFAYYDIGELETTTVPGIPELETTTVPKFTAKETRSSTAIPWSTHAPESFTSGFHCGGLLTDPTGYIYGPYYPGNGASMECIWEIQTTSYSHIELDFYYVSSNLNCRTGYVEVYDGALGSRKLGRVCSGSRFVYISTSNRITIVLYRNSYQAGDAFNAYYYSFTAATSSEPMRTSGKSMPSF
nr:PREDICTED: carbohydrate-binding protein AWN [Anolis carolinensis]|eukprot:XP_016847430.1 PREDICTED: carbohydrate-binding protein AWN [Anolis carolinensis]